MIEIPVMLSVCVGMLAALLMPRAAHISRLWQRPGVKGPGDFYAQAFQAIVCMIALGMFALLASMASLIVSIWINWRAGMWMSVLPVLTMTIVLCALRRRLKRRD